MDRVQYLLNPCSKLIHRFIFLCDLNFLLMMITFLIVIIVFTDLFIQVSYVSALKQILIFVFFSVNEVSELIYLIKDRAKFTLL